MGSAHNSGVSQHGQPDAAAPERLSEVWWGDRPSDSPVFTVLCHNKLRRNRVKVRSVEPESRLLTSHARNLKHDDDKKLCCAGHDRENLEYNIHVISMKELQSFVLID